MSVLLLLSFIANATKTNEFTRFLWAAYASLSLAGYIGDIGNPAANALSLFQTGIRAKTNKAKLRRSKDIHSSAPKYKQNFLIKKSVKCFGRFTDSSF